MGHAKAIEKDNFADVIEKIQMLTASQQRFLQEMLAGREKVPVTSNTYKARLCQEKKKS